MGTAQTPLEDALRAFKGAVLLVDARPEIGASPAPAGSAPSAPKTAQRVSIVMKMTRVGMSVSRRILGGEQDHLLFIAAAHGLEEILHGSEGFEADQRRIHRHFPMQEH